jgi:hypothetical protein
VGVRVPSGKISTDRGRCLRLSHAASIDLTAFAVSFRSIHTCAALPCTGAAPVSALRGLRRVVLMLAAERRSRGQVLGDEV